MKTPSVGDVLNVRQARWGLPCSGKYLVIEVYPDERCHCKCSILANTSPADKEDKRVFWYVPFPQHSSGIVTIDNFMTAARKAYEK